MTDVNQTTTLPVEGDEDALPPAHTPLLYAVLGFAMGLADLAVFAALDVQMRWGETDVRIPVVLLFATTFAALGYALGRVRGAAALAIRDRRIIERQLETIAREEARARQAETLASIGRMAAGLAHEIRNPLAVIRSAAGLVRDELDGVLAYAARDRVVDGGLDPRDPLGDAREDMTRACAMILDEVGRLDALIAKLLGYARPAGFSPRPVDVAEMLRRAARVAEEAGVRPEITVVEGQAMADPDLVEPALAALALNAAQASRSAGSGRVRLTSERRAGELVVEVADDGPGVSADVREALFRPFVTTRADGTGLGLATARKLIEAHRGEIRYVDGGGLGPEGAGALFRVRVPLVDEERSDARARPVVA